MSGSWYKVFPKLPVSIDSSFVLDSKNGDGLSCECLGSDKRWGSESSKENHDRFERGSSCSCW